MGRRRRRDSSVLLPWERHGNLLRRPSAHRLKIAALTIGAIGLFIAATSHERRRAAVRDTRTNLWLLHRAVDSYRDEHDGRCPESLQDLLKKHYLRRLPKDAWGTPFVFRCPGRFDPSSYDLSSAGPDRIAGGLDRIE